MFASFVSQLIAYLMGNLYFLGSPLIFMILYVWSRKDPERPVSFWGFAFKAWHLPFVYTAVSVLLGASPLYDILGILVGHAYFYLKDIVPVVYNKNPLTTPEFMYQIFDQTNVHARAQAWRRGQGHRLGGAPQ
jgi:Derlin-2/3